MITIVDYQMGNLRSVQKAFERVGVAARISSLPEEVAAAERLVVPGVGAFADAMQELAHRGLIEPIRDFLRADRPFLGICLGLQLLFERSSEGGEPLGLGVLPGEVKRFQLGREHKVPHMGWNAVRCLRPHPLWEGLPESAHVYFVHSYYVEPSDAECVAMVAEYGAPFCAMVRRGNLYATQFHPEKSQSVGLRMLGNFARA